MTGSLVGQRDGDRPDMWTRVRSQSASTSIAISCSNQFHNLRYGEQQYILQLDLKRFSTIRLQQCRRRQKHFCHRVSNGTKGGVKETHALD